MLSKKIVKKIDLQNFKIFDPPPKNDPATKKLKSDYTPTFNFLRDLDHYYPGVGVLGGIKV